MQWAPRMSAQHAMVARMANCIKVQNAMSDVGWACLRSMHPSMCYYMKFGIGHWKRMLCMAHGCQFCQNETLTPLHPFFILETVLFPNYIIICT